MLNCFLQVLGLYIVTAVARQQGTGVTHFAFRVCHAVAKAVVLAQGIRTLLCRVHHAAPNLNLKAAVLLFLLTFCNHMLRLASLQWS